jgi:ribosome-binding protein aMBF1 (putative translation factor)
MNSEPRLLGAPRNGGHRIDLRDNYAGSPDFVDEWDRRSRAFKSGAAYGAVSHAPARDALEDRITVDLELALRIREAREAAGFTRRQVAQRLGVKPNWVQELENQRKGVVPKSRFERLCRIIGLQSSETGNP